MADFAARLTSKGQLTVPKAVREALGLAEGDQVIFRVEGERAIVARTRDLLALAGSVAVTPERRGAEWETVRDDVRRRRADRAGS